MVFLQYFTIVFLTILTCYSIPFSGHINIHTDSKYGNAHKIIWINIQ